MVIVGHPGTGKTLLTNSLQKQLGSGWKFKHHDDWIHSPDPDLEGIPWYKARPRYAKRTGELAADAIHSGAVGYVSDGVLANQGEVDRLIAASGMSRSSGGVLVVSLVCPAEVAYDRIKKRDPDFVRREGCPTVEAFRMAFYDPYSPKGITVDLEIDTVANDESAVVLLEAGRLGEKN